ncbi:site-specific integrase [Jeotgalicoccus sp. S0W5]|uniref:tyrosine-type recombinase/integrase n=1 Tax=Jeotgalicoccus sp. S0W5 TaxID=2527874 RepID=UPI001414F757|nr:site-specific integrase [Jeotgalicoccus sp. S0W5]
MEPKKVNGKWGYNFSYQGKRYRKQGFATKKEAQARIQKIITDVAHGVDSSSNESLFDYYERWVDTYKLNIVSDKSYNRFISTLKKMEDYFPPNMRLKDLDQDQYQSFINHYAEGLTKNSVLKMHQQVRACLEDAVYNGLIPRNPTYRAKVWGTVAPKKEEYKYMQLQQYVDTKEYFRNKRAKSALLLFISHVTGGRFSEVNTIKYEYFDFENNKLFLNGTKTEASPRTITLASNDMAHIKHEIEAMELDQQEYIFNIAYRTANDMFSRAREYLGIDKEITINALRHTHCSYLYNHGVSIHYISKRLGHKSIRITLDVYNHIFEETYENDESNALNILNTMPNDIS